MTTVSRLLSVLAILSSSVAGGYLLYPQPFADVFFTGWVLVSVGLTLVGAIGAWTNRTPLVWVAALLLTALSVVGMWSIGPFIAPAALLSLGSAICSQRAGPRERVRREIVSNPPTVLEGVAKTAAGIGSVVVGGWLVYVSAVTEGLFDVCASETLACTLDNTHWDAVGVTVVGLIAISVGGWAVWKQVYIARVLTSNTTSR